jgi:hypothetical protein
MVSTANQDIARIRLSEAQDKDFSRAHQSGVRQTGETAPDAALLKLLDTESRQR